MDFGLNKRKLTYFFGFSEVPLIYQGTLAAGSNCSGGGGWLDVSELFESFPLGAWEDCYWLRLKDTAPAEMSRPWKTLHLRKCPNWFAVQVYSVHLYCVHSNNLNACLLEMSIYLHLPWLSGRNLSFMSIAKELDLMWFSIRSIVS